MEKKQYRHLSSEERALLAVLRAKGNSITDIARALDRDQGTISRELKRNQSPAYQVYLAHKAHERAVKRKQQSGKRPRLKTKMIQNYVVKKLRQAWSPEQIAGRLSLEHPEWSISYEAIYQFIYDKHTRDTYDLVPLLARSHRKRLPRTHSHRHKVSHIPRRISIKERPKHIANRIQPGHWEADTAISRKSKPALAVVLERKSRLIRIAKLKAKTAREFRAAVNRRLRRYPENLRRTITYDNGSENVEHLRINHILGTTSYFCEPFHSWEKASVENSLGLVRRFFPKKTDFAIIDKKQIKKVEYLLNTRPKKCLGYKTPLEVFKSCVALAR
ncbi:MAG: IS30 family transposase [bacterium]|nr:IS30 family transposase [bacterium]